MHAARLRYDWDIFCRVIDNHGDIGVCWRLACQLARRGQRVRLWADDASALAWMAPGGAPGVEVAQWRPDATTVAEPADVVVEAFGCQLDDAFVAAMAARAEAGRAPAWINLEYLSAEDWVARSHGLSSPVMAGPGAGLAKFFFYPGFTPSTGGLLREDNLAERQARFDRAAWLRSQGVAWQPGDRVVSLFCYEPAGLRELLAHLAGEPRTHLLVTPGRAAAAVRAVAADATAAPAITWLPPLPQPEFDHLLWSADLNFVRGEDSLVRALWAGQPFVWQIYPQDDDAHHDKLDAFLGWMQAPDSLRRFSRAWNGITQDALPAPDLAAWQDATLAARARLLAQADLVTQLQAFLAARQVPTPEQDIR